MDEAFNNFLKLFNGLNMEAEHHPISLLGKMVAFDKRVLSMMIFL